MELKLFLIIFVVHLSTAVLGQTNGGIEEEEEGSKDSTTSQIRLRLRVRPFPDPDQPGTIGGNFTWIPDSIQESDLEDLRFKIQCERNFSLVGPRKPTQTAIHTVTFNSNIRHPMIKGLLPSALYTCRIIPLMIERDRFRGRLMAMLEPAVTGSGLGADSIQLWIIGAVVIVAVLFIIMIVVWIFMCVLMYKRSNKENKYAVSGQQMPMQDYRLGNRPVPTLPGPNIAAQIYEPIPDPTYKLIKSQRNTDIQSQEERHYHVLEAPKQQESSESASGDHTYHILEAGAGVQNKLPDDEGEGELGKVAETRDLNEEPEDYEIPTSSV